MRFGSVEVEPRRVVGASGRVCAAFGRLARELNRQNLGNTDDGKVTREEEEEMRRIQHQDEPQAY